MDENRQVLTAYGAFQISKQVKQTNSETFVKVYDFIQRKIHTAATMGKKDTIASLPCYLAGASAFKFDDMLMRVSSELENNGFYVCKLTHETLYISWRKSLNVTYEAPKAGLAIRTSTTT
jgi:hypothetical protein